MSNHWIPVTRACPCPICGKPDWCTIGERCICCMRSEGGQPCKNGGQLFQLGDTTRLRPLLPPTEKPITIDAAALMRGYAHGQRFLEPLAASLGVSIAALMALGCAWAARHYAWAFPMKSAAGETIGIRLRSVDGHKWSVKGSRAGLFYAEGEARIMTIVEGPTDCAAGLSIGLATVGRPSCLGCEAETNQLLRRKKVQRAIIVSDNDEPGYRGAEKLQGALSCPSVLLIPPGKDLRACVQAGLTAEHLDSLTHSLVWTQPKS